MAAYQLAKGFRAKMTKYLHSEKKSAQSYQFPVMATLDFLKWPPPKIPKMKESTLLHTFWST